MLVKFVQSDRGIEGNSISERGDKLAGSGPIQRSTDKQMSSLNCSKELPSRMGHLQPVENRQSPQSILWVLLQTDSAKDEQPQLNARPPLGPDSVAA